MNTLEQGHLGEVSALEWLVSIGAHVAVPLGPSPDWDLVAELEGRLLRVQVKTSRRFNRQRRWEVRVCTRSGNAILLGGPKYAQFEVDPGRRLARRSLSTIAA